MSEDPNTLRVGGIASESISFQQMETNEPRSLDSVSRVTKKERSAPIQPKSKVVNEKIKEKQTEPLDQPESNNMAMSSTFAKNEEGELAETTEKKPRKRQRKRAKGGTGETDPNASKGGRVNLQVFYD